MDTTMNTSSQKFTQFQIFDKENLGSVRTTVDKETGTVWFAVTDVCKILEIRNTTQATSRLDTDEKIRLTLCENESLRKGRGGARFLLFVNESGLYSLIFTSYKQKAKDFRRWVTSEVLPSIRQNGAYVLGQETLDPKEKERLLNQIKSLRNELKDLKDEYDDLRKDYRELFLSQFDTSKELVMDKAGYVVSKDLYNSMQK